VIHAFAFITLKGVMYQVATNYWHIHENNATSHSPFVPSPAKTLSIQSLLRRLAPHCHTSSPFFENIVCILAERAALNCALPLARNSCLRAFLVSYVAFLYSSFVLRFGWLLEVDSKFYQRVAFAK
jgi:hypothetical protein